MTRPFLVLAILSAAVGQAQWQAGAGRVDITPREPIWMAGYAARTQPSSGVRQEIFAKALALRDQDRGTVVLVTLDLIGVTRELAHSVTERARRQFGLERDRIALNASHTHSGPLYQLRGSYQMTPGQEEVIGRYGKELPDKIVAAIGAALADLAPATLAFEQGFAGFAVNRRRVGNRHYPGPVDHDVPVLAVRTPDGRLRAVVAGYACHATVLADYVINGDWPGYAQREIERMHPGVTALFVAGCGADANPLPRRSVELAELYGKVLANAVSEVVHGKMKPLHGPLRTAFATVPAPFQTPPTRTELEARRNHSDQVVRRHAERLLAILDRDGKLPDSYPYPIQVWRLGDGLKFVALGGEVVVDYALRLKSKHGWDSTWVAGYANDVMGYIPSVRVLREGGYEGGGAMLYQNHPGPFAEAIEDTIVDQVAKLIEATSRGQSR